MAKIQLTQLKAYKAKKVCGGIQTIISKTFFMLVDRAKLARRN
jgi:hypothetical protein